MRNNKKSICILIVFILSLCCIKFFAVDIGSDSAVTRFNSKQSLVNGDRIAGFAWLTAGFELLDINTQATYDSIFPVSGNVALNGGSLILNQDLIFHNNFNFSTLGDIDAQGHMLELSCSATALPNLEGDEVGCVVYLATSQLTQGNRDIYSLDWSVSDTFLAVGVSVTGGTLYAVEIWEWNGEDALTFRSGVNPNGRNVECVRWHPTKNWLAVGTVNFPAGSELYIYQIDWTTAAFTLLGSANVGGDLRSLSWHPSGNYIAAGTTVNGSEVQLFPVSGAGVPGTPITVSSSNVDVTRNDGLDWDYTGSYLAVSFEQSVPNPELVVYHFNNLPSLSLTAVANINIADSVRAVDWNQTYSQYLAIGIEGNVSVTAQVVEFVPSPASLTVVADLTGINKGTQAIDWNPGGTCIAIGTTGPNTNEFRVYYFDKDAGTTEVISQFDRGSDTVRAVRWGRSTSSVAVGGDDNIIYLYRRLFASFDGNDPDGPGAIARCFRWSDICLVLNNDITLNDRCILFSGCSAIHGRGHCITMTPDSRIFLDTNSILRMENLCIKGISSRQIGSFSNQSNYILNDVEWYLDGNYTFTKGFFEVEGDFKIFGEGYTFGYKSESQSVIDACGRMILEEGLTFSYDPVTADKNLLKLLTDTSELILNGATLHSTSTGLQLTKGKLIIDRHSYLSSDGQFESEAISFGDGIKSSNNLCIELLPSAILDVIEGCVVFNDI